MPSVSLSALKTPLPLLLLFACFLVLNVHLTEGQCRWTSNGFSLDLSSISGTQISGTESDESFNYYWTPCTNYYSCDSESVMAGQYNPSNGKCNILAYTDSSVSPSYDGDGKTWAFFYENGATCSGSARKLDLVITCM